jgi:hypothetical protein
MPLVNHKKAILTAFFNDSAESNYNQPLRLKKKYVPAALANINATAIG